MNLDFKSRLKLLGKEILDFFYSRECLNSGAILRSESDYRYLSDQSINEMIWAKDPACLMCGYPFAGEVQGQRVCPKCKDSKFVFLSGKTAFVLKGPGKKLVHEFKYHKGFHLLPDIVKLVKRMPGYIEFLEDAILVPVPLHRSKMRRRGFNQSFLLAESFAKEARGAKVVELLKRVKKTATQTYLGRDLRQKNVKNAFALSSKAVINGALRYVIIDDVFTTGATLNACANVLKENGAKNIHILTLGHG